MSNENGPNEAAHAKQVTQCKELIRDGQGHLAIPMLEGVVASTPSPYFHETREEGILCIRFWTLDDFNHYVKWMIKTDRAEKMYWTYNAYPQAHYYLGMMLGRAGMHDEALRVLRQGQRMEPFNPRLDFQIALKLVALGQRQEALQNVRIGQ